jgi:hypothetical protein
MHVYEWCQWLESTSIGAGVRNSDWLFPMIESVHMLGIVLLVAATGLFDLRLLGPRTVPPTIGVAGGAAGDALGVGKLFGDVSDWRADV